MEKYGFVYIWRDRKHNRYYIGSHWGSEDDGYICSSTWMRNAYKIRTNDFKRRILARVFSNRKDLLQKEEYYLSLIKDFELKTKYYNISKSIKDPWFQHPAKLASVSEKISIRTKEAMQRSEVRKRYDEGLKARDNKGSNPDIVEKRRQSMIKTMAEKFPEENRRKSLTEEERKKYYSQKGKDIWANRTEQQRKEVGQKISEGLIGKQNRLGQSNSEDHRLKISKGLKGRVHFRHKISINGIIYESSSKASESLNISVATINRRLKSNKYIEYYRLGSES